jgi:nicotinate-nucleotide pyrophosphorylase (carboxylating)
MHSSQMFALPLALVDRIVERAIAEDLSAWDVTTEACIEADTNAIAHAVARRELVVCGGPVFERVFKLIDPNVEVEILRSEGSLVGPDTRLWLVRGRARSILMGERIALNLAQRMSGVATITHAHVRAIPVGSSARITDTRKTTPGLRILERYAVRVGGGKNHRDDLGSAVLIKDNHVIAAGGITPAIERAKKLASHTCKIECEVDSLEQLDEALAAGADIVLLDNMPTDDVAEGVRRSRGIALTEASGGITLERIAELARAGVDAISVGALTHSAPAADIGLDFSGAPDAALDMSHDASQVSLRA